MDSLTAMLQEFFQILGIVIDWLGKDYTPDSIEEIEQDSDILDEIFKYIETAHASSFINNETIMFSIDDVKALIDRFVKEEADKYQVYDI